MIRAGLIGEKLGHSLSPQIHGRFYHVTGTPGSYALFETPRDGLSTLLDALEREGYTGLNVTIPYKTDVIPLLDHVAEEAAAIGAVNTIHFHSGKREGHNTDYYGLKTLLETSGIAVTGQRVVILGTGGAARCAHRLAQDMGASTVVTVSRTPDRADKRFGAVGYDALDDLGHIGVLINTTPAGMYPDVDGCPVQADVIARCESVVDLIYNPYETQLLRLAKTYGKRCANGLVMLSAQAVKAQEIWNGRAYDASVYADVASYMESAVKKTNIVLIGMPGSGKTTVGKLLATRRGMDFADTDAMIEHAHGPIPKIFAEQGEAAFRCLEKEATKAAAQRAHTVISTGGGIILDADNIHTLKETGVIVFIDRPLKTLLADTDTTGRPLLADGQKALKALYTQRYVLYKKYAEIICENTRDAQVCACDIITKLEAR